ncbi:hypothetical protein BALOs_1522 [Halobacteriovorax sp. BALOs_7]|uniref:Uncharacterized protein n=1 Tax=Halobacteriovorax vibrionivorans TaxID=2152716 RepID=A0ABY0IC85_9BACT|nr:MULTISPECIES: hypothetical protein [Halobacteriovorax]AYF44523.1 hypothetical protein BALOs_1522 [Halobacteriovorax sp. BALOs_7]RZF20579.1 hypothetical protein DAY19_11380 [Halobacteriovorax vibrionivorans]TGD47492.1 hypothetical protein EP118_07910 [Halobacteriovorax sp. Y22]
MKKLLLLTIALLSLNTQANDISERELSTVITIAPFYITTEATVDALTQNEYEEAGQIAADGVVTDQERDEMSVELLVRLDECLETFGNDFGYDELDCLKEIARYDD